MKISTKGRYGLRIMLDIAENGSNAPVRIADISVRQEISVKYTEQITGNFVKCGLLRSVRGAQGGYVLLKKPEEYTVFEILEKCEGELFPVECVSEENGCGRSSGCAVRGLWQGLYEQIVAYLSGITLRDLLNSVANPADFYSI